jgi:hypothetical protein
MKQEMIKRKSIALLLTGAYVTFAFLAIKSASHAEAGRAYASLPIVTTIAYIFCAYFFIEIQRGNSNLFEKAMAWSSAAIFVIRLAPLLHAVFPSVQLNAVTLSHLASMLTVVATIALILRTIQLFGRAQTVEK